MFRCVADQRLRFLWPAALLLFVGFANADIPRTISYQGKVTDAGGIPVADGTYTMRFRILDVPTGGTNLWNSGDQSVNVSGGVFSVVLGESPQPEIDLPFDDDYWLAVRFEGVNQIPRQRITSTGYAYIASGLVPGTEVIGEVTGAPYAVIKGTNTATTGTRYGIYGEDYSPSGAGVRGVGNNTSGNNSGGVFQTLSTWGTGVRGEAIPSTGNTSGGLFESNSVSGTGVYGRVTATTGATYGVYGETGSASGYGVYGLASATTGFNWGVFGRTMSSSGWGVYGLAGATTGTTHGVYGLSISPSGHGVYGFAFATEGYNYGMYGQSRSSTGTGVFGDADAATGTTYGVYGHSASPTGYGLYYSGGLAGTGTKSCVVKTSQGPTLFYCQESSGNWFEDFGTAHLVGGHAHVELDRVFQEAVTIDADYPMHVFVQLRDACEGVYVKTGQTGFDVIELREGTSNASFSYRVVAKRRGFESNRNEVCEAARTDPYLYPELREKKLRESEEERAQMQQRRELMEADHEKREWMR